MRMLNMLTWTTFAAAMLMAVPAGAGTLYKWKTEDGTISYTDSWKRVPKAYRAHAERTASADLQGYERYTPRRDGSQLDYAARLQDRIARLRAINEPPAPPPAPPRVLSQTVLRLNDRVSLSLPNTGAADEAPVVVEDRRVLDPRAATTTHVTVVRRGDKVLSIVRPEPSDSPEAWQDASELFKSPGVFDH